MTPELRPDPGQVFASDEHRRVLGHLPPYRTSDEHAEATRQAIEAGSIPQGSVLPTSSSVRDLVEFMVKFDAPQSGHITLAQVDGENGSATVKTTEHVEEILADLEAHGFVAQSDGIWAMTKAGLDALNGSNGNEPPALEGRRLEAAQLQDQALQEEEQAALAAEPAAPNFPLGQSGEAARSEPAQTRREEV